MRALLLVVLVLLSGCAKERSEAVTEALDKVESKSLEPLVNQTML